MDLVCLGDVMLDVLARLPGELQVGSDTPAPIELTPGGSAANTAAWAAFLGTATTLVARIGDDVLGRAVLDTLAASGLDLQVTVDPRRRTGTCVVLVAPGGERTMVPDGGANDALADDPIPEAAWHGTRQLHLSGYALFREGARDAATAALATARELGCGVSVDAASVAPLRAFGTSRFLGLVDGCLVVANRDEAEVLTDSTEPAEAARRLARQTGEAVVKCGPDGAVWSDGQRLHAAPAPAIRPVDTTGAGDAFAAGLLTARLRGAGVPEQLTAAAAAAATAVARVGGGPPRQLRE